VGEIPGLVISDLWIVLKSGWSNYGFSIFSLYIPFFLYCFYVHKKFKDYNKKKFLVFLLLSVDNQLDWGDPVAANHVDSNSSSLSAHLPDNEELAEKSQMHEFDESTVPQCRVLGAF
jgi:hypothetical protein